MKIRLDHGYYTKVKKARVFVHDAEVDPTPAPGARREFEKQYYLRLYTQPWWRVIAHRIYHRYEMNRIVHAITHRIERPYGTINGNPYTVPMCAKQAERCYHLSLLGRTDIVEFTISKEVYEQLWQRESVKS